MINHVEGGGFADSLVKQPPSMWDIAKRHEALHGSGANYWKVKQYESSAYDTSDPAASRLTYDDLMKEVAAQRAALDGGNATVMSVLVFSLIICVATGYGRGAPRRAHRRSAARTTAARAFRRLTPAAPPARPRSVRAGPTASDSARPGSAPSPSSS